MDQWRKNLLKSNTRHALPIMTYPGLEFIGGSIFDIVTKGENQYKCIEAITENFSTIAGVMVMDLSVEAEAFGAKINFHQHDVPDVMDPIVYDAESIENLKIPTQKVGRMGEFVKAAGLAAANIKDKPIFGGMIGPYSLAVRLFAMTEFMMHTLIDPESTKTLISKTTKFLIEYAKAYKDIGANGIIIAEPAAGLLAPSECNEFSSIFVKSIVEAVQDDSFMVILHNCGNTETLTKSMLSTGAEGLHFGNSVDILEILKQIPQETLVFGNLDPVNVFKLGNTELIRNETLALLNNTKAYKNYVISSGCDIPPFTDIKNIQAFFNAVDEFNKNK